MRRDFNFNMNPAQRHLAQHDSRADPRMEDWLVKLGEPQARACAPSTCMLCQEFAHTLSNDNCVKMKQLRECRRCGKKTACKNCETLVWAECLFFGLAPTGCAHAKIMRPGFVPNIYFWGQGAKYK